MAREMICGSGLSGIYCAEAVLAGVITGNRTPTTAVQQKTPNKCFNGKKLDVSNLKVFGCLQATGIFQMKKEESGMLS